MTIRRVIGSAAAAALLPLAACHDGAPVSRPSDRPRCESMFPVPHGFQTVQTFEEPYPDHIGTRVSLRDGAGRRLFWFAGIPGEYGEGLPTAGRVEIASGERVPLIGADGTWVVSWDMQGVCGSHAILGNGFSRKRFTEMLRRSGIVAPT
jgi:hypothetical protein